MKKGFTLTELMIVVVIIGVLLAILLPQTIKMIDKSREDATKANLNSMKTVIATYYGDNEVWPADPPELTGNELRSFLVPSYLVPHFI